MELHKNGLGVVDHYLAPPLGAEVVVPMRVVPNGEGCERLFPCFQLPGMSDDQFAKDAEWVAQDSNTLKRLMEHPPFPKTPGERAMGEGT